MYDEVIENGIEYIKDLFREHLPELLDSAKEHIKETLPKIRTEMIPTITKFVKNLSNSKSTTAHVVETLTMQELLSIARGNIVEGANGFAVFKAMKDKKSFVYMANCKNQELLDETINKYAIIQADVLSKEVEELFEETDLIILQ